jgi:ABC-2 type transport system permease protein
MRVFAKSVRDNRRGWIGWILAVTAIASMYTSFWPTIGKNPDMVSALEAYPEALKEALHLQDLTRPESYLASSVFGLLVPLLVAFFAISAGVKAVAGDEEAGTLDLILAHPVSRISLALQRFGAIAVAVAALGTVLFLAVTALRGPAEFPEVSIGKIFAICFQLVLFGLFFAALSYAVGAWTGKRIVALGVSVAVVVLGYLGDSFLPQVDGLKWTEAISPFDWYLGGEPLRNGVQLGHATLLLGLAVLLVALGTWRFNRRDVTV